MSEVVSENIAIPTVTKPANENGNPVELKVEKINGTSHESDRSKSHKSEHKDKHRDKDRDRHRSDKDKDRHRNSSSKSSHKDKERDRERDKDRSKDDKKSPDKDRQHKSSNSSSKDKERSKDGNKDRHSSSKDKHHSSSSKDKERHREKDRDRDKDKEKHREKSSSGKDRERHESSKDKDRQSSSSKDKHSSGDKSRDRHHEKNDKARTSHSDKERNKERERGDPVKQEERIETFVQGEEKVIEVKQERQEYHEEEAVVKTENKEDPADESNAEESLQIDENVKDEPESEEDIPLTMRAPKRELEEEEDDEEDVPLFARIKKIKTDDSEDEYKPTKKGKRKSRPDSDEEEDFKPAKKKTSKSAKKEVKKEVTSSPKKGKKAEEEAPVWKWWEEEKKDDGTKWKFLEHKGPLFAPEYEPLPDNVKFYYDGKVMKLTEAAEEVATFYARMLNHDYTAKEAFNTNFFKDWRKTMSEKEKAIIKELRKCNFKEMHKYFEKKSEERKAMSKEEKKKIKDQNEEIQKEYGFCKIDGHVEKIGNFRVEPPGLFRGRGEHPKMGMHKRRVLPEDVIINCSKDSNIPVPPKGHKWKKVQSDTAVTWLASWIENVQGNVKYVMLNPSSKLKGEKDMMKYETARKLAKKIHKIRETYEEDWKSKEMRIRQRAVALYFIDRLALRAGNEKDEDQADTVGCCSLRVEHVDLRDTLNGKENVVVFDFLGKDSIRYYNEVPVHKRVFKNLKLFMESKKPGDDLFDRLNTTVLNKHLNELMDGLTAKVFRTYNASFTLQNQLNELTNEDDTVPEKLLAYNRANRAVAILCNHQRSVPKTHEKSMENLKVKIDAKRSDLQEAKNELKHAKRSGGEAEKLKKKVERLKDQLMKLELQETDREENKTIALGTSKLNYLDPRISVAWCKKYDVPIEKIFNKTQRDKFRWAIEMAGPDYVF